MKYNVVLQQLALADLREAYQWAARSAPFTAARWLDRFQAALQTLDHDPGRCGLARENGRVNPEIREYLFGKRPYVFRAIFVIDDDVVRILRIRRAQRRPLTQHQLEEALQMEE